MRFLPLARVRDGQPVAHLAPEGGGRLLDLRGEGEALGGILSVLGRPLQPGAHLCGAALREVAAHEVAGDVPGFVGLVAEDDVPREPAVLARGLRDDDVLEGLPADGDVREEQVVVDDHHADAFGLRLGLPGKALVEVVAAVAQAVVGLDRAHRPHAIAHDHRELEPVARLRRARPGVDGAEFGALFRGEVRGRGLGERVLAEVVAAPFEQRPREGLAQLPVECLRERGQVVLHQLLLQRDGGRDDEDGPPGLIRLQDGRHQVRERLAGAARAFGEELAAVARWCRRWRA